MSSLWVYGALCASSITPKPGVKGTQDSPDVQEDLNSGLGAAPAGHLYVRTLGPPDLPGSGAGRAPAARTHDAESQRASPAPVSWDPSSQPQQTPRLALGALLLAEAPLGLTPVVLCCRGALGPGVTGVQMAEVSWEQRHRRPWVGGEGGPFELTASPPHRQALLQGPGKGQAPDLKLSGAVGTAGERG